MKQLVIPFLLLVLLATSCKDDFDVAAPYKNITLVYATLNRDDTAHYFRIEKAFLDQNKSAIDMAKVPDSSFYTNLTVVMKEYVNNAFTRSWTLNRVKMEDEGYPKDAAGSQGFFTTPSWAYKLKITDPANPSVKDSLDPYKQYRLVVTNQATGETDSSDIIYVVNSRREVNANNFYIPTFDNLNYQLDFSKTDLKTNFSLLVRTPKNARLMEGVMRFHFVEKNMATGASKRIVADYYYDQQVKNASETFMLTTLNSSIYSFLRDALGTADANTFRFVDSCDLMVYAGSSELYNYLQISAVQNSSLLGDQIKPFYTNIRGNNAYGLICSRALRVRNNIAITSVTIDSLKLNPITADLNIKGRTDD